MIGPAKDCSGAFVQCARCGNWIRAETTSTPQVCCWCQAYADAITRLDRVRRKIGT